MATMGEETRVAKWAKSEQRDTIRMEIDLYSIWQYVEPFCATKDMVAVSRIS